MIFILLVYAALFRLVLFIEPVVFHVPASSNYLSQLIYDVLNFFIGDRVWIYHIVAWVLVFLQALYFNHLINYYRILQKPSYLPAMSYILVSSLLVEFTLLTPALLANTFILFSLSKILACYKKDTVLALIFDSGLMVSIASLFFFPYIVFFLFVIASLLILRPFNLREYLMAALGLLVPYYFIGVYFFWYGKLPEFWQTIQISHLSFPVEEMKHSSMRLIIISVAPLIVILWSFFFMQSSILKMVVQVRIYITVFIFLFVSGALSMLIQFNGEFYHFVWMALPMGLPFAIFFSEVRRRFVSGLLHLFLVLAILYFQYFFLLK